MDPVFLQACIDNWRFLAFLITGILVLAEARWQVRQMRKSLATKANASTCVIRHEKVDEIAQKVEANHRELQQTLNDHLNLLITHIDRNGLNARSKEHSE